MTKYHPFLIALHWLLALGIIFSLLAGSFMLAETPTSDPSIINKLAIHMGMGIVILVLTLLRLITRLRTGAPAPIAGTPEKQEKIARLTHWLLYLGVIAMSVSGIVLAQSIDLGNIVFFGADKPLPQDFEALDLFEFHETIGSILMVLIVVHVGAAIYHQHIVKDGIMSRMSFRNK